MDELRHKTEPLRDCVNGLRFHPNQMRECPEPHVREKYGTGGVAWVSLYTCKKCKYHTEFAMHGGIGCSYELGG